MYYTYELRSLSRNYIYVGLTDNIDRRLDEHQTGRNKTTKPYRPFELIFSECHSTRAEARAREKYFKTGIGKVYLKSLAT